MRAATRIPLFLVVLIGSGISGAPVSAQTSSTAVDAATAAPAPPPPRDASAPKDASVIPAAPPRPDAEPATTVVPVPPPQLRPAPTRPTPARPSPRARRRRPRPTPEPEPEPEVQTEAAPPGPPPAVGLSPALPKPSDWTFWQVGPPAPKSEGPSGVDRVFQRLDDALWPVVQVVFLTFLLLRLAAWLVRRGAHRGRRGLVLLHRGWVFAEGTVWLLIAIWALVQLSARESPSATLLAILVLGGIAALSWSGLRDVAAGLMLAAERSFSLGDLVRLEDGEGFVRAFRSRVLELEAPDGERIRVPYRRALGANRVRRGGRQTAHAVRLDLDVPDGMDPQEALRTARELAASSPWAVIGEVPRVDLGPSDQRVQIRVIAFAFAAEAEPLLHADLLSGWKDVGRRAGDGRVPGARGE